MRRTQAAVWWVLVAGLAGVAGCSEDTAGSVADGGVAGADTSGPGDVLGVDDGPMDTPGDPGVADPGSGMDGDAGAADPGALGDAGVDGAADAGGDAGTDGGAAGDAGSGGDADADGGATGDANGADGGTTGDASGADGGPVGDAGGADGAGDADAAGEDAPPSGDAATVGDGAGDAADAAVMDVAADAVMDAGPDGVVDAAADVGADPGVASDIDGDAPPEGDASASDVATGCTPEELADCDDGNPCTDDICLPDGGACRHSTVPNGTPCGDADATCLDGVCGTPEEPTEPGVTADPACTVAGEPVTCVISEASTTPSGYPVDYTYRWEVDGTPTAYDTETLPGDATHACETWTCYAEPSALGTPGAEGSGTVQIHQPGGTYQKSHSGIGFVWAGSYWTVNDPDPDSIFGSTREISNYGLWWVEVRTSVLLGQGTYDVMWRVELNADASVQNMYFASGGGCATRVEYTWPKADQELKKGNWNELVVGTIEVTEPMCCPVTLQMTNTKSEGISEGYTVDWVGVAGTGAMPCTKLP